MKPLAFALIFFAPAIALANGNNSHAWISLRAVEKLPPGTLRELLEKPEHRGPFLNGTMFPDGGYVVGDNYGEMAHWEPFVSGYVEWIRARFRPPFGGEAARHVAFLMGAASHGMADQVFDSMFFKKGHREDAAGWSDELLDSFDTATDVFLVAETHQMLTLEPWYPSEIPQIFREKLGYAVDLAKLENAQYLLVNVVLAYGVDAAAKPDKLAEYRARYPWGAANLLDPREPGSPPVEAEVVAAYLRALWDRLHDELRPENLVLATVPSDGARGQPTDHTRMESQLIVVFGHFLDHATLPASAVVVLDSTGKRHEVEVGYVWGSKEASVAVLHPKEDWPADEDLTVTLQPGLRMLDGLTLDAPWSFRFSTRLTAASEPLPGIDPTPRVGEPAGARVASSSSGCAIAPQAAAPASGWILAICFAACIGLGYVASPTRGSRRGRNIY